ncbi:hypothetical protein C5C31_04820 [Rathayibacter rathayi]|uniref:hypothetical protein n=1 Tax=Rathayibacter rathayi TaxID=33887 RepID=UPI000CE76076|nr:hypothetical protein [Rathayibacter rathayi]PPG90636.1 hypothetical protein C5C47_00510 [Rathayibacter rathayi]PPG98683.1 hypothetical protein C5C00_01240 [Rathayibacter rathayi]PPH25173.1 hypothetical protein C5C31_04820 [Rathayibacter rathayi]
MTDNFREVQFFPDATASFCLWASKVENITPTATELGASQELEDRITAWYQVWEDQRPWDGGFDSPDVRQAWRDEGDRIVLELRRELEGTGITIVPRFGGKLT